MMRGAIPLLMAGLMVPSLASAQTPPLAQTPSAARPAAMPVLTCRIDPRPFGPGTVTVTNVGMATVEAGRTVLVVIIDAGGGAAGYPLRTPLQPGGSASFPLSGASL